MKNREKAALAIQALKERYPDAVCSLSWGREEPFRLLVMAILSAQCTDARVNEVSGPLFERFPTPESMAYSKEGELEEAIRPVGLYNSKARNLRACCKRLVEVYGGVLPSEMEELLTLGGVGRKVANLLRGDIYGLGGIVADTHCMRISERLGFTKGRNPLATERALDKLVPKEEQSAFCHRLVLFGRDVCTAARPRCGACALSRFCAYASEREKAET